MDSILLFQLELWREVSRHNEIGAFANSLVAMVTRRLPITRLAILRIDEERRRVESVALTSGEALLPATTTWPEHDIQRLLRWSRRREVQRYSESSRGKHVTFATIPPALLGEGLIGPLVSERGTYGVLIMQLSSARRLTSDQEKLYETLLEPCAVALDNDHRLHELRMLREAAEADKRFLLTRLGREEVAVPIVGAEQGLRLVMERVTLVARSDVPVLLLGKPAQARKCLPARFMNAHRARVDRSYGSTAARFPRS